ncbi:DUF3857 domain-containing protein [Flavobacterium amnicola]|uniref:DUF3857 domain-containing protein n=1 Tax=Flavobacterium amnicola TaxID=2506422 RepID=A0A4Q1K749_9FLAO|nr:DUF3857 domain-containing protein [Flavobacterium amnicola]RXR21360.1 DUF3857 domain-containing protein [Flavobacterium amnicola]
MRNFIGLLMALLCVQTYGQKQELGNVTIEELKERRNPNDTSAVATVLFEKGRTFFEYKQDNGFFVMTEVEVKLKIYKKEGYDYANKIISYYTGGNSDESVDFSKAITYNLVNGNVEKTKLKSDGEFNQQKNKYWAERKISMPNVKEGSIIEYKYTIKSPYSSSLPEWKFQRQIPVNYSEYNTDIPEFYTYNVYRKGTFKINETKSQKNKSITLTEKIISRGQNGKAYETITTNINYIDASVNYSATNVPALKDEEYVNNIDNYTSAIQHELASTQFRNQEVEYFSTTWDAVVKNIYENSDFGAQLNKTGYFEKDIDALVSASSTKNEKINAIFNFVKSKMKWNNFRGYICDEGVKEAYKTKVGGVAEINLMLTAMLRYAGIEANPVLLSTRDNGIAFFPNRKAYNYVISGVEDGEEVILLDATNPYSEPNILPINDLNWFGRMIRRNGTSAEINLNSKMISKEIVRALVSLKANGEITGKINEQYTDYNGFVFRNKYNALSEDAYLEKLEKRYNGIQISEYTIQNKQNYSSPIIETYSFVNSNAVEIIGGKIYFSPLFFLTTYDNPFKQDIREYPIDFTYPNQEKYLFVIEIPEGYEVESLPKPINLAFSDNSMTFKFNILNEGRKINVSSLFEINTSIYSPDNYEELKAFYTEMIKKQTEKIVLKKV